MKKEKPGMHGVHLKSQLLWRWRQEDLEFKASLCYIVRPSFKNKIKQKSWVHG
jgi:hypothetical protein